MIKKFKPYLKGYGIYAILGPVMTVSEVLMEVYIPYLMAQIIDIGISNGDRAFVIKKGAEMVICALLSLTFGILGGRFTALASTGFSHNLRGAMFRKIQDFSFSNIDHFSTASLITRITTDVSRIENSFRMFMRNLFRNPIMMVMATVMAFRMNARLSCIFLLAIPVLGIAMTLITVKAHPYFMQMMEKFDSINSVIEENLTAVRVVKAFVRHEKENEKFGESVSGITETQKKAEHIVILNNPVMNLVMYMSTIAIFWFGGKQMIAGTMLTGSFLSFLGYIRQILFNLSMLSMFFVNIVMSGASFERVGEVLDELPDINDDDADPALQLADGSVCFKNVSFNYNKKNEDYILSDINLDIKSGETIGIIGATGSAKSTFVQLIPRLYDATVGEVLVGGRNVKDYSIKTLRNSVAMVLQKNLLFSGTIKDNLKWGKEDATDEEVIAACKAAQAHNFIMSFPDGYDTELGQGGVNVSGGQKQRLCIARALLKHPKILILDDSTSAVDTATDRAIRTALKAEIADTTTFIIAQRISSVSDADRVIVLDEGRVNAFGTPDELLATNEIYRDVYESQQKGAQENV